MRDEVLQRDERIARGDLAVLRCEDAREQHLDPTLELGSDLQDAGHGREQVDVRAGEEVHAVDHPAQHALGA